MALAQMELLMPSQGPSAGGTITEENLQVEKKRFRADLEEQSSASHQEVVGQLQAAAGFPCSGSCLPSKF